ncbi:hypothetical protein MmiHf6_12360 [Methanimicrococcus hongohii]|uniref:Uncharacterized protein n=2 Tax=Methanimicrococcus hongohii TaxID=3028295 RepID=A0AA96V2I4_9EURY|nr:hypothetical protein MmiHf6_12360 [Methanimicrococcus sp. Hf6]
MKLDRDINIDGELGDGIITQILNKNQISFIECCILSFPSILMLFYFISLFVSGLIRLLKGVDIPWRTLAIIGDLPLILSIISIFIFNSVFYNFLKKKYDFKLNVFFYGVGFTSCCVTFIFLTQGKLQGSFWSGFELIFWSFLCMFSFMLTYYCYAILLQNEEKRTDNVISYLIAMILVFSLILIVLEIITSHPPIAGGLLLIFVLYLICCVSFTQIRISLRGFAWSMFLPSFVIFWYVFLSTPFM